MTSLRIARLRLALLPAAAVFLVACVSVPPTNSKLDDARALYDQAAADTDAARSAPLELRSAQQALTRSESALAAGEDSATVEHYAYLARQRSATALQAGEIARSEQAVAASAGERERILMAARTSEANQANSQAEKDRAQAERDRMQAGQDRAESERARMRAETASAEAEQSRQAAEAQRAAAQAAQADSAKLQTELAELQAKKTDRGMVLTLGDVLFDTGRAELKGGAFKTMDRLTTFMRDYPERTLAIEGYTDSIGTDAFNLTLSQRRADAVRSALVGRGVDGARIATSGLGKASPVASNDSAAGRQRNRRVEIVISGTS